jgi:hypothetical protein
MKTVFILLIAVAALSTSCQKEANLGGEDLLNSRSTPNQQNEVPFTGDFITSAVFLSGPPLLLHRITGTGNATHLGNATFLVEATLNVSTPPPFGVTGTGTFTAANGDQFYTTIAGLVTPTGPTTQRGELTHTIIGGTGRFQNASGSFLAIALVNSTSATNTVSFNGSINY